MEDSVTDYAYSKLNRQFIGGAWVEGSGASLLVDQNPFDGSELTRFTGASMADVDSAYFAAATTQPLWESMTPYQRRSVFENAVREIEENRAEFARIIREEVGGTAVKAAIELDLTVDALKAAAALPLQVEGRIIASPLPDVENLLYRKPVGVVAVISPFNLPLFLSIKSVAPALAVGNSVVLKPHEQTPVVGGTLIAKMFERAGLPPGVLNVVVADIKDLGDGFIEHPIPRVISFTGSTGVGRHIASSAARTFKRAVLELGGNSALVVLDDADLELAVDAAVFSRFTHQGQVCMSANRVVVARELHDEFVERYVGKVAYLPVGDPADPDTIIGPLISEKHAADLDRIVQAALDQGSGKPALLGSLTGTLMTPTVLTDVSTSAPIAKQELFGPVALIFAADDDDHAVTIVNDSPYGLSGAVHSRDIERAVALAHRFDTGMVHINDATVHDEAIVPFGGEKLSGMGRLNGDYRIEEFTTTKWISVNRGRRHFPY
ncbi:aldehyde dehydrogenase [Mycobacteroides franklinii]|uniref:Aldehyde dehydrogenase n=1 Tax=Mycobacteroides franklinii TaxID=948102 RepID=A0A1S1L5N5_9MYCO|nr:aldehyde dehydrogenase family protein [Mycobacteroides franklinii]OHU19181.1 aldehyde dehydrogenase [Mycobacteroides franklinii]